MNLHLKAQNTLLAEVEALQRDTSNARWSDAEIYASINRALDTWADRVFSPQVYTVTNGWVSGTNEYTLPAYLDVRHLRPQAKRTIPYEYDSILFDDETDEAWQDIPAWEVDTNGSGGYVLRWTLAPWTTDGRILWWSENGRVPTTVPALNAAITATDTSLVVNAAVDVSNAGYVKVDSEWIGYTGVTRGATTTTLTNLIRGLDSTTAAIHAVTPSAPSVYWGIAAPRASAFEQLKSQVMAYLHALFLTNAAPAEREHHLMMVRYYQQDADMFWRKWTPFKSGGPMRLHRHGVGW